MNFNLLSSIPASLLDWALVNLTPFGILIGAGWLLWKTIAWVNKKFDDLGAQNITTNFQLIDHNKRIVTVEGTSTTLTSDVTKLHLNLVTLDKKVDALNDKMELKFIEVDRRFDLIDKRFELIDKKFDKIDSRFDRLETKLDDTRELCLKSLARMERQDEINKTIFTGLHNHDELLRSQQEINMKLQSMIEATQKNPSP